MLCSAFNSLNDGLNHFVAETMPLLPSGILYPSQESSFQMLISRADSSRSLKWSLPCNVLFTLAIFFTIGFEAVRSRH
jgi:hypothetical protein